jgi:REP element-mobilizing transposase RayT
MTTIFRECKSPSLLVGGAQDHIHALFALSRTWTLADIVEEVKTNSSKWIKTKGSEFRAFHWRSGYGVFSIGQSQVGRVKQYIANQREHHRRRSFKDEFRGLLRKY